MKLRIFISILVLGIGCIFPAFAAETPEEFSARYLDSMRRHGMKELASFIHPEELKKLAELVIELADVAEKSGKSESLPFLKGTDTLESLRKLPPLEVANKFFSWISEVAPQLTEMLRTAEAKTIGHVTDGDTVYVVAKLSFTMEGEVINATDVLPLRRDGDSYKALLKAEMAGILRTMKKAMAAKANK